MIKKLILALVVAISVYGVYVLIVSGIQLSRLPFGLKLNVSSFKEKLASIVHNHWFLAGVTAGVTFFILAAIAGVLLTYALAPESFFKVIEVVKHHISEIKP